MRNVPVTSSQTTQHQTLSILGQVLAAPFLHYIRPWYLAYLLLGIVTAGMVPVLLPLMMMNVSHTLSSVAYVMGVYDLGLLTSPLWGLMSERGKSYRVLFFAGFLLSALAIAVFPFMHSMPGWMVAAFVLGAGSSGVATVASLLIVDFEPSKEWEPRIGLLQSFNGTGQVVGLLLAGVFSHGTFSVGLWVAAIVLVPALVFARMGLPAGTQSNRNRSKETQPHRLLNMRGLAVFPHINLPSGIEFHFHALNMSGLRRLPAAVSSPFGRFLLSWFMLTLGVAGFFTYFPLMLEQSYGLNSHYSSMIYATMAAIGIVLFIMTGRWSQRWGAGRVYQFGLWLRLSGFLILMLPFIIPSSHQLIVGIAGFCVIIIAWPILSVSGTNVAAELAPFSEGAAMGLFNMAFALATVIGAFASGPLITALGYSSVAAMGLTGIALAIVLGWGVPMPAK